MLSARVRTARHVPRPESAARQYERVTHWNARYPVGTAVTLERDNGAREQTVTRSEAWMLSGHTAVVMVDGVAGGYLLSRVTPVEVAR